MAKIRKIPQRQCVGCREMKDKKSLLRVVKSPEGSVGLDFRGKMSGRGAYVCYNPDCLKRARKTRALERALSVSIPPDVFDEMEARLQTAQPRQIPDAQTGTRSPEENTSRKEKHPQTQTETHSRTRKETTLPENSTHSRRKTGGGGMNES